MLIQGAQLGNAPLCTVINFSQYFFFTFSFQRVHYFFQVFQSTKKPSERGFRRLHYTLTGIRPFSKYGVSVVCKFAKWGSESGPVYNEFTSLQQGNFDYNCMVWHRTEFSVFYFFHLFNTSKTFCNGELLSSSYLYLWSK